MNWKKKFIWKMPIPLKNNLLLEFIIKIIETKSASKITCVPVNENKSLIKYISPINPIRISGLRSVYEREGSHPNK